MKLLTFLKHEFKVRSQRNPNYSLRSFAQHLGIDASLLSKIIRGERKIGEKTKSKIIKKLGLDESIFSRPQEYRELDESELESFMDQKFDFLLEALKLEDFRPSERWLAKKLGLGHEEVKELVKTLEKIGLLKKVEDNWFDQTEGYSTHLVDPLVTSFTRREYQKRVFENSLESIDKIDYDQRDHSSIIVASNTEKVIEVKKRIKKFRRELLDFLSDVPEKNTIYQVAIGVNPIVDKEVK